MSEITTEAERDRGGRFVKGGIPGPGRPKGARSRLGEQFVEDLRTVWLERGIEAIHACIDTEPAAFLRVISGMMPRDLNINMQVVDATDFAARFRAAYELLGNEPPQQRSRRPLPGQPKLIEHDDQR